MQKTEEKKRLETAYAENSEEKWLQWGPYLSERQWGTVREDYSPRGTAWDYFSHDQARSRAYRWGEDGLAGISDTEQKLCFSLALWNGRDPILKERLFGLTNSEGNHGEDVKEYYYYLDNTPSHSYMKYLYKYPQASFPYNDLVRVNGERKAYPESFEYELLDTGVFSDNRYFDVQTEYAKASPTDILIKITVTNNGPDTAQLHVLPTLWFRNTWAWFNDVTEPSMKGVKGTKVSTIEASKSSDGVTDEMVLYCENVQDLFFVNNETNNQRLFQSANRTQYVKDGINDHVVYGSNTVNPELKGTKASAYYQLELAPGESKVIRLRLSKDVSNSTPFGTSFESTFKSRIKEADKFYASIQPSGLTDSEKMIQRQAYAGMLWGKQYYLYIVEDWLNGDPAGPKPPAGRSRNNKWTHLYAGDVLSMPDKWEYPWFAAWDLCFQAIVLSRLDVTFAKKQLEHLAHEWYMSPDGAIPAYEWSFSDINPPLHAWAALKIFKIEQEMTGEGDYDFLADIFQHCLLNFTWWANEVDVDDNNLFEGGFLGLDNISVVNRSDLNDLESQIGNSVVLNQSDGTSWMGMFCLKMMEMASILSDKGEGYSNLVSKFFQHFVYIADAINNIDQMTEGKVNLWDEADGFYYDFLTVNSNPKQYFSVKLRSLVGVIALFPAATLNLEKMEAQSAKKIRERIDWFLERHPHLVQNVKTGEHADEKLLLSFVNPDRLKRILSKVLDETEFLSPHGIRGVSKVYEDNPYRLNVFGVELTEKYAPSESLNQAFGGNSNWRGPVWFPINFLFIETLKAYHEYLGDDFKIEYPSQSGNQLNLLEIANAISQRMVNIFERDSDGKRPVFGGITPFQEDPKWKDYLLFYEYFHGDNGAGLGASHQTGWTGLVAELINTK